METTERTDMLDAGFRVIQSPDSYRFSRDTVLLAEFIVLRKQERILELGMGDGALAFLLLAREKTASLKGIECRPDAVDRARRGIRLNALEERCEAVMGDVFALQESGYTLAVSNPPYPWPLQTGQRDPLSRVMPLERLPEWCSAAAGALIHGGRFCIVYPAEFVQSLLNACSQYGLSLKRLAFTQSGSGGIFRLCLAEMVKNARPGGAKITIFQEKSHDYA